MRNLVVGILVWGVVTNVLFYLPAPRNVPVALCTTHGLFYPLEVSLEVKDGSREGEPKTDSLLLAAGILSLASTSYCFGLVIIQQAKRNAIRSSSPYLIAPLFATSVASLLLFVLSVLRNDRCNLASGSFLKVVEVGGIIAIFFMDGENTGPRKKDEAPSTRKCSPADSWDPTKINLGFK